MTNLASILSRSAATDPIRTAIVLGDTELDYATLDLFAPLFAGALRDLGVAPGEHVALVLPNVPQFSVAYFGCHYAGNPVVPLNVLLTEEELAYHLANSQAVAVVAWDLFLPPTGQAAARTPSVRRVLVAKAHLADLSAPAGVDNLTAAVMAAQPVAGPTRRGPTTPRSSSTPPAPPAGPRAPSSPTPTSWPTPGCPSSSSASTAARVSPSSPSPCSTPSA